MTKMNLKNLGVFFLAFASVLLLAGNVVAVNEMATITGIKVDDVYASNNDVAITAGETMTVKVFFTALETTSDVKVRLSVDGQKVDVSSTTPSFNIEKGKQYSKTLTVKVPYELQNEVSDDMALNVKIWNSDFKTENSWNLRVQRPSYNAQIMSIDSAQTAQAGENFPIDVVIKNNGYNNLDDLYVKVKIAALGVERTTYFGDLVSVDTNYKEKDIDARKFYIQIPYDAKEGTYTIEVEASNGDLNINSAKQITVKNEFSAGETIVTSSKKSASVGEKTDFELIVTNPTDKLRVYRVVTESNGDLTTSSSAQLVAVPAGMTKTITVTAEPQSKGEYTFDVSLFAGEQLVDTFPLTVYANGKSTNSIIALTIILAVIFLVLLGALIVMLRKKPENSEEFGESYY